MPSLLWTVCCSRALVDQQSNRLSLVDITEEIALIKPQTVCMDQLYLVCLWEKNPEVGDKAEDFTFRLRLRDPAGEWVDEGFKNGPQHPARKTAQYGFAHRCAVQIDRQV